MLNSGSPGGGTQYSVLSDQYSPWPGMNRSCERRSLRSLAFTLAVLVAGALPARGVTGFHGQRLGSTVGFVTSLAVAPDGALYYTTTTGDVVRFDDGANVVVAHVPTESAGDAGLLGMAFVDPQTAVVHYSTPGQTAEVIALVDVVTGQQTVLHSFTADISMPGRSVSAEHHGGNPIVTESGDIYFGIGDFGGGLIASLPEWSAGKILRVDRNGNATQIASGFRNPFDLAWDAEHQRLVVADNGASIDDEINIVDINAGGFYGWPFTAGNGPVLNGAVPPVYTFATVVAPTGIIRLNGANAELKSGYLLGAFVGKTIFYIPDIDARPLPDPIPLLTTDNGPVIDVAQTAGGEIFFATGSAIYELTAPLRGDCNGDGRLSAADLDALRSALSTDVVRARSTGDPWGCDANGDGLISGDDLPALVQLLALRVRAVRSR